MGLSHLTLVEISNSFTKCALGADSQIQETHRVRTDELTPSSIEALKANWGKTKATAVSCVVPAALERIRNNLAGEVIEVSHRCCGGLVIRLSQPQFVGADRLSNAAGCLRYYGSPGIVVDLGTAITFDVVSGTRDFLGGVIAPGLATLAQCLHGRTALLPAIEAAKPKHVLGKSTVEAIQAGAWVGSRGMVREILLELKKEVFGEESVTIVATGGDAARLALELDEFTYIDPLLTLKGIQAVAEDYAEKSS